ncbi:MAG: glycosyltransferase [Candidatus Latescibacterota bacterium]|nr:glycosyltransferase [Candidatus Latescibacterota bacterium]
MVWGFADFLVLSLTLIYAAGAGWFLRGIRRGSRRPVEETDNLRVAVVIAARDEEANIATCLRQLGAQDFPREAWEILLVDDGSRDGTGDLAKEVLSDSWSGPNARVLSTQVELGRSGSKKDALNLGIRSTGAELILTTDADCKVPESWVRSMVASFSARVVAVVGFSQIGELDEIKRMEQGWEGLDFLALMTAAAGSCGNGYPLAASGQNLAFRRTAFVEVGGYERIRHRASGDDVLLLQLLHRSGRGGVVFAQDPKSHVSHPASLSFRDVISRRARWASNAPIQLTLDPLFFLYLCSIFALSLVFVTAPLLVAVGAASLATLGIAFGLKATADLAMVAVGARRFRRGDLLRYAPVWILLQPFYTVVVGVLGVVGRFEWKGRVYRRGRSDRARDTAPESISESPACDAS